MGKRTSKLLLLLISIGLIISAFACFDGNPFPKGNGEDLININSVPEGTMEGPGEITGTIKTNGEYDESNIQILVDGIDSDIPFTIDENGNIVINVDPGELNLPPGEHTITVQIVDDEGNVIDEEEVTIIIGEIIKPKIEITTPQENEQISGQTKITGLASDEDGTVVKIEIVDADGNVIFTTTENPANFSIDFDTTTYTDGKYTWSAIAYDDKGNHSKVDFTFIINNSGGYIGTPPTITISAPTEGETVSGSVNLTATVTAGNTAVTKIVLSSDCATPNSKELTIAVNINEALDFSNCSDGVHQVTITATDENGNVVTKTTNVVVNNGSGDPTIPHFDGIPTGASDICDDTPSISWTTVANATGYILEFDKDLNSSADNYTEIYNGTDTTYEVTPALADGKYFWRIRAKFSSGNGDWSADFDFTVLANLNPVTGLSHDVPPTYGDITCTTYEVTINYTKSTNADKHTLEIATDSNFTTIVETAVDPSLPYSTTFTTNVDRWYRVTASKNDLGNGCSLVEEASSKIIFNPELADPTSMNVTPTCASASFSWTAASGIQGYTIDVATDSDFTTKVIPGNTTATTSSFTTTALTPGTTYYWRLNGTSTAGCKKTSVHLNGAVAKSFTVPNGPVAPTSVTLAAQGSCHSEATFTWTTDVSADHYAIELYDNATFTGSPVKTIDPITSGTAITSSDVTGATLYCRVGAVNTDGCKTWTNYATPFDIVDFSIPSSLSVTADSCGGDYATFSWANHDATNTYKLELSTSVGFGTIAYTDASYTKGSTVDASDEGLATATDYYCRITATKGTCSSTITNTTAFQFAGTGGTASPGHVVASWKVSTSGTHLAKGIIVANNKVYVTTYGGSLFAYDLDGSNRVSMNCGGTTACGGMYDYGIDADASGNLYVVRANDYISCSMSYDKCVVRKIALNADKTSGTIAWKYGQADNDNSNWPYFSEKTGQRGIAVYGSNIYMTDAEETSGKHGWIWKVETDGTSNPKKIYGPSTGTSYFKYSQSIIYAPGYGNKLLVGDYYSDYYKDFASTVFLPSYVSSGGYFCSGSLRDPSLGTLNKNSGTYENWFVCPFYSEASTGIIKVYKPDGTFATATVDFNTSNDPCLVNHPVDTTKITPYGAAMDANGYIYATVAINASSDSYVYKFAPPNP